MIVLTNLIDVHTETGLNLDEVPGFELVELMERSPIGRPVTRNDRVPRLPRERCRRHVANTVLEVGSSNTLPRQPNRLPSGRSMALL